MCLIDIEQMDLYICAPKDSGEDPVGESLQRWLRTLVSTSKADFYFDAEVPRARTPWKSAPTDNSNDNDNTINNHTTYNDIS